MMRIFIFIFIIFFALPAHAGIEESLTAKDKKLISQVEDYLNSITTMSGKFMQVLPRTRGNIGGSVSYGKVYLSRPGKVLWQYEVPSPVSIYINDDNLVYYDRELDQISHSTVDSPLANILSQKNIALSSGENEISGFFKDKAGVKITVEQRDKGESERVEKLTLVFMTKNGIKLSELKITNPQNRSTTIKFIDLEFGKKLDEEIFEFKNPRLFNRKKRN